MHNPLETAKLADLLPRIEDVDLRGRRVLLRADLNVTFEPGTTNIADDSRIHATMPTIELLRRKGAAIIACSHLGRPRGRVVPEMRIEPVRHRASEILGVDVVGAGGPTGSDAERKVERLNSGDVAMLENLRFDVGEEANDATFSRDLASLADVFVNDAFGASHRRHASIVGVAQILPAFAGLLMRAEIDALNRALMSDDSPAIAILGGAKVADKLGIVSSLAPNVDAILIGGGMIAAFIAAQGNAVGFGMPDEDEIVAAKALLDDHEVSAKLRLPDDVVVATEFTRESAHKQYELGDLTGQGHILDIGSKTIGKYANAIKTANKIVWNGPMGLFEWPYFANGTRAIAQAVACNEDAFKLAGGGSTVEAINVFGIADRLSHISTGGGASLEFLEGKVLPGIAALRRS